MQYTLRLKGMCCFLFFALCFNAVLLFVLLWSALLFQPLLAWFDNASFMVNANHFLADFKTLSFTEKYYSTRDQLFTFSSHAMIGNCIGWFSYLLLTLRKRAKLAIVPLGVMLVLTAALKPEWLVMSIFGYVTSYISAVFLHYHSMNVLQFFISDLAEKHYSLNNVSMHHEATLREKCTEIADAIGSSPEAVLDDMNRRLPGVLLGMYVAEPDRLFPGFESRFVPKKQ
jgi:hypothetical protein